MQGRYIAIGIIALAVLVSGYLVWNNTKGTGPKEFFSSQAKLIFTYPGNYVLTEHEEGSSEREWSVVILTDQNSPPPPENSEGLPSIVVVVFDNLEGQTLEEWIRGSAFSNFKLSDETLASTTVGGEPALAYRYSGLYENDAVAVIANDKIYFFAAGWITELDQIRQDFQNILTSVEFTL